LRKLQLHAKYLLSTWHVRVLANNNSSDNCTEGLCADMADAA